MGALSSPPVNLQSTNKLDGFLLIVLFIDLTLDCRLEESHTSETIYKNQESFLVNKKLESAREHELLRRSELAWAESDICPKEADGTIDTFVESSERLLEDQVAALSSPYI